MRHRRATAAIIAALSVTAITQTSVSGSQPDPGGPSIDVSPDGAAAGATVTVTGSGFVGDCDVVLYWSSNDGAVLGAATVSADGTFSASVAVPSDAKSGNSAIEARGRQHADSGCGADSGTAANEKVNVTSGRARGQKISLIGREIDGAGVDQATIAQAKGSSAPVHAIVQLHSLPQAGDLDALAAVGITPLAYLNATDGPGTAYLASIAPSVSPSDARFTALVRGVHAMKPSDKVEAGLAASAAPSNQSLDAIVMFFSDVSAATAESVLAGVGASGTSLGLGSYKATLTRAQVQQLATLDPVQFLAEAPELGQLDLDISRTLINADPVQNFNVAAATYLGYSGFGVQIGIHDSGVDDHHNDFDGRMIRLLHPAQGGDHGTHVASIAAGSGVMSNQNDDNNNPNGGTAFQWRGIAPQAGISAFNSQTGHDLGTMTTAIVTDGNDVSNHSYSYNDGQYDATMVNIDTIIRGDAGIPARPQVFSAGNQGVAPQFGENSGYFSLSKSCKNCIMVANLQANGALNGGSSHGPTPDGRLKPEVGALGTSVVAAGADVHDGNTPVPGPSVGNSYRTKGGTSMATPAVTGTVALLLQQYAAQFGVNIDTNPPLPSTLKAILVQTAVDQVGNAGGTNPDTGAATVYGPGPDWGTGYGSVDAQAASEVMADERFLEDTVDTTNVTDTHFAQVAAGDTELRITLAWDDLPGTPNADHSAPQLVNDLDLILIGPNGEVVQPLVVPPATQFDCDGGTAGIQTGNCGGTGPGADPGPWPSAGTAIDAAPGTDRLNNLEQVVVPNPAPGLWTARVSVLNTDSTVRLPLGGTQPYSLVGVSEARADLRIIKTDSPDPVHAGTELIYTVTVVNDGPDTAEGVVVVDTLPPEVIYLSDDGGCTYSAADHELTCPLGDIPAGASRSFRIKTMVEPDTVVNESDGTLNIVNTVSVSSSTPDLNAGNNTDVEITFVQDSADLKVTKLCKPDDPVLAGRTATCTIFVDNLGPSYARSVELTDTHVSDGTFTIGTITTSQGSCAQASGIVTCNLGNLANATPSTSGRATITVELSATEDVDINDVATVVAATPDPNTANNQATEHVSVLAVADLALTKTGPPNAIAGTDITYDLSVTNDGPSTAPGVVIEDLLPSSVTIVSVSGSGGASCNAGQPGNPLALTTCSFGTLAPGDTRTMQVIVHIKPDTLGIIHNDARASSSVLDTDLSDNLASVATEVTGSADLSITKSDSPDPVVAGTELTYTIVVENAGPSTAFDVRITDTLPAGTTFVEGVDGNGVTVCALLQPGIVVCDLGTMAPGSSETVFLTVFVDPSLDPGSTLTNTAEVTSSTPDPDPSDNVATEDTTVITRADVWLDKQAEFRSGNPSNVVTFTLVVHNDAGCEADAQSIPTPTCGAGGPSDARDIVVTDPLPLTSKKLIVQFVSPSCVYDKPSHTVTCTADNDLPVGQTVTFVVEAQISGSVGTVLNTASVATSTTDPNLANNVNGASFVHQGGTGGKGGGGPKK